MPRSFWRPSRDADSLSIHLQNHRAVTISPGWTFVCAGFVELHTKLMSCFTDVNIINNFLNNLLFGLTCLIWYCDVNMLLLLLISQYYLFCLWLLYQIAWFCCGQNQINISSYLPLTNMCAISFSQVWQICIQH